MNDTDYEKVSEKHPISGAKNEGLHADAFDSGMFTALQERHDFVSTYCGHGLVITYYRIEYGFDTAENYHLLGSQVMELGEIKDSNYIGTRIVFARGR